MALPPPPPPRPEPPPAEKLQRDANEARVAALRAELEATPDKARQAILQYEIGFLFERKLHNDALAVKEYLSAYNLDPTFRPPLFALVRVFERRRSFRNLARLYEAEARSAQSPEEKASATIDRAALLEDHLVEPATVRVLLEEAQAADTASIAASLMLERKAYGEGDRAGAVAVVAQRALHSEDPVMRAVLLAEVAWAREETGDVDGALAALREAAALPAGRLRVVEQWERIARKHERVPDLVEALEARAELAAKVARGEGAEAGSGAFSVRRFADSSRAAGEAAALYREAARLRTSRLSDAAGAAQAYAAAIALRPDDVLLRLERITAAELGGDLEAAAADARHLLSVGVTGPLAASLHFREAERALATGDRTGARGALAAALASDPESAAAAAMLDDLAADDGLADERATRLAERAATATLDARTRAVAALEAAQLAADALGDAPRAAALYAVAASQSDDKVEVLREAHGAAMRLGDAGGARDAGSVLLGLALEAEEKGALLYEQYGLLRGPLADEVAAEALLRDALADAAASAWAPDTARVHGARTGDPRLLAAAHEKLAALAEDDETAAAHLSAAGRALARAGEDVAAMKLLRTALERAPGQRYAVALLEEILRSRGEADEVVALLRQAAAAQQGARAAETALLLAGAAAEAAGDVKLAAQTYEEASDRDATAVAPLHALEHLARQAGDAALLLRAREGLAQREASAGSPGRAALDLADHYDLIARKPDLAEAPLRSALPDETVGAAAAAALLLLPQAGTDAGLHAAASERLLFEATVTDGRARLAREAGGAQLGARDLAAASTSVVEVLAARPADRWALLAALRLSALDATRASERPSRLSALAAAVSDPHVKHELSLAAVRARLVTGDAEGAAGIAAELANSAPDAHAAAIALAETLPASLPDGADELALADHATRRADALSRLRAHAGTQPGASLAASLGRAQMDSGEVLDAYDTLLAAVEADATDLATWESLRVAAREVEQWEDVVRACDVLAQAAEGVTKGELSEEAASLLMDQLGDDEGAMKHLASALDVDVRRPIAYGRMHDLLAERDDAKGLTELLQRRIAAEDDDGELVKLFYELARVRRSLGDREATITALENLLLLEPAHVGGLALMVETCVSLERFEAAVDALRSLATADVPPAQRRLARLGAADFLEHKLKNVDGALGELAELVTAGLADGTVFARIADVSERAGRFDEAVQALADAAQVASGEKRSAFERRAGRLHLEKRDDLRAAVEAYQRALVATPTDTDALEALTPLLGAPDALAAADRVVAELRQALAGDPTDPALLRLLARTARLKSDRDLLRASLATLVAIGLAEPDEYDEVSRLQPPARPPRGMLEDAELARIRAPGDDGSVAAVLATLSEAVLEMDGLEPGKLGVGRGDRVKDTAPLKDEVTATLRAFGVALGEFYVGGHDPGVVAAFPRGTDPPAVVCGAGVSSPLTLARRFALGQAACALRFGVAALLFRQPEEWSRLLVAAAVAAEAPLPVAAPPGTDELAKALRKALSRKARGALPQQLASLHAAELDAGCRAVRRTMLRAGLLVCGDLGVALEAALGRSGGAPGRDVVRTSDDARDLVLYFLGAAAERQRRALGLST